MFVRTAHWVWNTFSLGKMIRKKQAKQLGLENLICDLTENRTPIVGMKTRCPNR